MPYIDIEDTRQPKENGVDADTMWGRVYDCLSKDLFQFVQDEFDDVGKDRAWWLRRCQATERDLAAQKKSYNEEVDQFNAGYEAGEKGGLDPFDDAPHFEPDYDVWRDGYYAGSYDRLTAELVALKERTRWIPVGERLPEEHTWVIVQRPFLGVLPAYYGNDLSQYKWHDEGGNLLDERDYPTHWIPLPEPPEDA